MEFRWFESAMRITALVGSVATSVACGGGPPKPPLSQAPFEPTPAPSATPSDAATSAAPAVETPSESAEEGPRHPPWTPVGVQECDKFVDKFVACVGKHVPLEQRDDKMRELNTHRARWRELLNLQEGKVAAGLACRGVAQRLKNDLIVDFGCEF
jgi:hypothetical protein